MFNNVFFTFVCGSEGIALAKRTGTAIAVLLGKEAILLSHKDEE